jgi:hypothetical protein
MVATDRGAVRLPFGARSGRAPNKSPDYLIDLFFRSPRISVD